MFSLAITAGVVLGLSWLAWRTPAPHTLQAVDDGVAVLLGCLVGGRLAYVWVNWDYYQLHVAEAPQFWLGGFSGVGAGLGGVLVLPLLAWLTRQHLGRLAERMLPLLVVLPAAGWLGCWEAGCAYGVETNAWWGLPASDEWGVVARRLPVQLCGALLALAVPWLAEILTTDFKTDKGRPAEKQKKTDRWMTAGQTGGRKASLALLGLALTQFGLTFWRADPAFLWYGLRLEAWGALVLAGLSLIGLLMTYRK